jgi:hypothetical protein
VIPANGAGTDRSLRLSRDLPAHSGSGACGLAATQEPSPRFAGRGWLRGGACSASGDALASRTHAPDARAKGRGIASGEIRYSGKLKPWGHGRSEWPSAVDVRRSAGSGEMKGPVPPPVTRGGGPSRGITRMAGASRTDRSGYPVRKTTLAEQDLDPEVDDMSPGERIGTMWQLALDAWAFTGKPVDQSRLPRYSLRVRKLRR